MAGTPLTKPTRRNGRESSSSSNSKERVERSRKMDDVLRQSEREEEDLKMTIKCDNILAGALP